MQALTLPAQAGWRWLPDGFRLFKKNPPILGLLVFGYWLVSMLLSSVPYLGAVAVSLCVPALSVGVMNGCRELADGRTPDVRHLFSAFRTNSRALFTLGGLYFAVSLSILGISALIDGGLLFKMMIGQPVSREALEGSNVVLAAQVSLALLMPVLMAWWYAPLLAAWHGLSAPKALFFSFVACWRNWRPFVCYGIAMFFFCILVPGALFLFLVAMIGGNPQFLLALLAAPVLLVLAPTVFASFYVTYRDVFVTADRVDVVV